MAFEIVKIIKGEEAAQQAQKHFEETVQQKNIEDITKYAHPSKAADQMTIFDYLKNELGDSVSSSEIRRVIEQGGVEINQNKATDPNQVFEFSEGTLVKFGKRQYFKVR